MQNAKTVLGIIRERGRRGLPLERVYRQLFNRELYLLAYGRIYRNDGAMTPGVTTETADGMSLAKIDALIEALHYERYQWTPVRRTYVEKKHSTKMRPLGLPSWSDKLLQEVIRLILEAYFEPQFSLSSHGFRAGRGCHTALRTIYHTWIGTTWFIEGDISQCFDSLDHEFLLSILREKIDDNRFLRLVDELLKAGYLEDWKYHATLSGTPQGGIVSPILSNIYLDRLDKFVEHTLLPMYNRGSRRKENPAYKHLQRRSVYRRNHWRPQEAAVLFKEAQKLPASDPNDPDYRRLHYVRYADDFLLGFSGPQSEAEEIKQKIGEFLQNTLKLKLSDAKTLITHARTGAAKFLGYEVCILQNDQKHDRRGHRSINGQVGLRVPAELVREKCQPYMQNGKPIHLAIALHDSDFSIVARYQQEYRGVVEYYRMAYNCHTLNWLRRVMELSMLKTLAAKFKTSVAKIVKHYKATVKTDRGLRRVFQVTVEREDGKKPLIAQWGGVSLAWDIGTAVLNDQPPIVWNKRTELLERLLADTCEHCGATGNVEVHHVRHLKDLKREGQVHSLWSELMAARHRKTMVLCKSCHVDLHAGRPPRRKQTE